MASHFRQGGRKIEVFEDDQEITIHAGDEQEAEAAARAAGVEIARPAVAAPGLVRASVTVDRDAGMSRLRKNSIVHHVYRDARDRRNAYLITDSFYVKFKPEASREQIAEYLQSEHLELTKDLGRGLLLVRVTNETGSNPLRTANRANDLPHVEYAEPNLVRELQRFSIPADTLFSKQWHLHAPVADGDDLAQDAGIFAPEAWDLTRGVRDIVVAVADDAIDLTHPDFQGERKLAAAWNLVPEGDDFLIDDDVSPRPGDYHGTPCAGVALAESDGRGVVGVAPGCALLAVRFPLSMSDHHFILMFERVSRMADVMSCSWGIGPADAPMSSAFRERLSEITKSGGRRGKGLVVCVAAGNNNCPVRDLSNTRAYQYLDQFGRARSYTGPIDRWLAAHPDVITVSASTSRKWRSAYSSWGREIWVCAPSDNWDDLNRVRTIGRGIVTTDNEGFGEGSDFTPGLRFTENFGGTSSATPTVAGVCALVLSRNPALSAAEVKGILAVTADKAGLVIASETTVNADGAFVDGHSLWFGFGKVNAAKAVQAALSAERSSTLSLTNANEVAIPDRDFPVSSDITVENNGSVVELRVEVAVQHTYIGDLRIDLVTPDGLVVTLHNHEGGSQNDLRRVYSATDVPALQALVGKPVCGKWSLTLVDSWAMDEGKLLFWRLAAKINDTQKPALTTRRRESFEGSIGLSEATPMLARGNG